MITSLLKLNKSRLNSASQKNRPDNDQADGLVRVSTKHLIDLRRQAEMIPLNAHKILAPKSGAYLSPFKGRGMEFEESRIYQAGDDIRNMDWRVTARTGVAHSKVFREERERAVLMWVDYRRPMFFATQGAFKSVMAARAAALLSWSAIQHGDRLGGVILSEQQQDELRPQRGDKAVLHFINKLARHPAWSSPLSTPIEHTTAVQSLIHLRRVAKPGSLIILFSDFHHLGEQAESHLKQLARHNDVMLMFFHDPLESQLPPPGLYQISNGQQSMTINTADSSLRTTHQQQFQQHQDYLKNLCRRCGMFFISCATNDPLEQTLQSQLRLKRK